MNRTEFLQDDNVKCFIEWFARKTESEFIHEYETKKPKKKYSFISIYDAYRKYEWKGKTLEENNKSLFLWSKELKRSVENGDEKLCKDICFKILEWGGVLNNNESKIRNNLDIINTLKHARLKLSEDTIKDKDYYMDLFMGGGFSKIYSLYLDDFIIYDSRVSSALCYLVRKYCECENIMFIPEKLKFSYSFGRTKAHRSPNTDVYKFIGCNGSKNESVNKRFVYITSNIKASWLLKEVAGKSSKFNLLPESERLRALEAALFMIGYEIPLGD